MEKINKMLDGLEEEIADLKDIIMTHKGHTENDDEKQVIVELEQHLRALVDLKDIISSLKGDKHE